MISTIEVTGKLYLDIFKNNILIEKWESKNTVVNLGRGKLCQLLANDGSSNYIQSISFGTSNINTTVSDTTITNEFKKTIIGYSYPSNKSIKFDFELDTFENNGVDMYEFGLKTADDVLFSRVVRSKITKESDVYLSGNWIINFN